jgi:PqqD family protein of HPr-rel-A system
LIPVKAREGDQPLWKVVAQSQLCWAEWGDSVLYHRPSGKTHFLNTASTLLLSRLLLEPKTLDAITEAIAPLRADPDPTEHADLQDYVEDLLLRFEELGLVERL